MSTQREVRSYETVAVFQPSLTEVQLKEEIKKVETLITNAQGTSIQIDNWGRRELAFISKKQRAGTYVAFNFDSISPAIIDELNRILRITESVILFQTHRTKLAPRKFKGSVRRSADGSDDLMDSVY